MSEHECPKCLCGPCMCHVPNEVLKGAAKKLNIGAKAEELYTKLEEIRTILSCRSGETVVEAAKRWRETVEWYAASEHYKIRSEIHITYGQRWEAPLMQEIFADRGQRARELLGGEAS